MIELDTLEIIKKSAGKILSVDFGDVRTGLAISDLSRLLASGLGYVSPGGIEKTADAVAQRAKEEGASAVVVGLPVNMDGSRGSRAQRCEKFASMLKERLDGIPVQYPCCYAVLLCYVCHNLYIDGDRATANLRYRNLGTGIGAHGLPKLVNLALNTLCCGLIPRCCAGNCGVVKVVSEVGITCYTGVEVCHKICVTAICGVRTCIGV